MKVSISNIAWDSAEEQAIADALQRLGIRGVEVAPGMIAARPSEASDDVIRSYRAFWNERGIEIVAMQALLFGAQGLALFETDAARAALLAYLKRIVRMGGILGARTLVFGSPKNRLAGARPAQDVERIATTFFREIGACAQDHGTCVCIEPVPPIYGADWITTAKDALAFVARVDHPGIGVHLDSGALRIQHEDAASIRAAGNAIRHFHASQLDLAPLAPGGPVPHELYAATLRELAYPHWVSIEMRRVAGGAPSLTPVEAAVRYALATYGG